MRPAAVALSVADVERARGFYEGAVGLRRLDGADGSVSLGAGGTPAVELVPAPGAPPRPPGTTGLFHLAILVPTRVELARAARRVMRFGWSLSGASDHLVSEALYLNDPEGNGIEIYRDRPRAEWTYDGGQVRMATLPLDMEGVLAQLDAEADESPSAAPETRLGHVHLNVADLAEAEEFYVGLLGFEVTTRGYPGALFVSRDGYHHHLGLNTWAGPGAPPPPAGARGLRWFELVFDGEGELEELGRRLAEAGREPRREESGLLVRDPSANAILLTAAGS